jgi:hypothetical protein
MLFGQPPHADGTPPHFSGSLGCELMPLILLELLMLFGQPPHARTFVVLCGWDTTTYLGTWDVAHAFDVGEASCCAH